MGDLDCSSLSGAHDKEPDSGFWTWRWGWGELFWLSDLTLNLKIRITPPKLACVKLCVWYLNKYLSKAPVESCEIITILGEKGLFHQKKKKDARLGMIANTNSRIDYTHLLLPNKLREKNGELTYGAVHICTKFQLCAKFLPPQKKNTGFISSCREMLCLVILSKSTRGIFNWIKN